MLVRASCVLLAALAWGSLTGCDTDETAAPPGPPSSSAAGVPASGALRDGIVALYAGDDSDPVQRAEADCFAGALLERLDPDALAAAGIVGDDGTVVAVLPVLDTATAQQWVAAQGQCADFVDVSTRAVVTQSKGKADAEVYETCLRAALTPDELDDAVVDTLTGHFDSAQVAALSRAQADCSRSAQPPD